MLLLFTKCDVTFTMVIIYFNTLNIALFDKCVANALFSITLCIFVNI